MNPYEAHPDKIPPTDRYADIPLYGRYDPRPDDFQPDAQHVNSTSLKSLAYWSAVLEKCTASNRIYESGEEGRDVFALGGVIVKSSHLKETTQGERDYSYADANECKAVELVRGVLEEKHSVKVPMIYFAGKINHRDVFIQQRIPGVGLNIAWQYLSPAQKSSFKNKVRSILKTIHTINPPSLSSTPPSQSYIVPDPDPIRHRGIQDLEHTLLFSDTNTDPDRGFMHNDVSQSNIIVDAGEVVALIDWEMAGFFGWARARDVHVGIRMPRRENFAQLDLGEEVLGDILFWNDLYDEAT